MPEPTRELDERTRHALVLCSRRRALPQRLLTYPGVDRFSIVVEEGHTHVFDDACDVHLVPDIRDHGAVLRVAQRLWRTAPIDRVVAPVEFSVPVAGFLRSTMGIDGQRYETALAFSDKNVMKQRLRAAGLPVTPFAVAYSADELRSTADAMGHPVVIKPILGGGGMHVEIAHDPAALLRILVADGAAGLADASMPYLVERYVDMEGEYHVDGIVSGGHVAFAAASKYFDPLLGHIDTVSGSYFLPAGSPDGEVALRMHREVVETLGMTDGVTHLELFRTETGWLVGEIACRPAGGGIVPALRMQYGIDMWDAFMATSLGRTPSTAVSERASIVVNADLPTWPGRIVALTSATELRRSPGVFQVDMTLGPGDLISEDLNSGSTTGLVYLEVTSEDEVAPRIQELQNRYRLVTDDVRDDPTTAGPSADDDRAAPGRPAGDLSAVTHVLVGLSLSMLEELDALVPPGRVLVLDEAETLARRDGHRKAATFPCVAAVIPLPVQAEGSAQGVAALLRRPAGLRAVIPGLEYGAVLAAALAQEWGVPGAGLDAARTLRDKARLRAVAERAGITQPRWRAVDGAADVGAFRAEFGARCVIKPVNGQASVGVRLLDDATDAAEAWTSMVEAQEPRMRATYARASRYLVEQRIDGSEVSVEALVRDGEARFCNVTAKQVRGGAAPVESGHLVPAQLDPQQREVLLDATRALVSAVGFRSGVIHAEWILTDGRPHLVECAGRLPGDSIDVLIDLAYGGRLVRDYVALLEGGAPPVDRAPLRSAAIRFLSSPSGRVRQVNGIAQAQATPGVHEVHVSVEAGTRLGAQLSSWDRPGYVISTGADGEDAVGRAERALAAITIDVDI